MPSKFISQIESKAGIILVVLFILYYLQGILYPEGSIISQTFLALCFLLGGICCVKVIIDRGAPAVVNWLILFYAIQVITFVVSPKTLFGYDYESIGEVDTIILFKDISAFFFSFIIMYYASCHSGGFDEKLVRYMCYAFFVLSIVSFFHLQEILQAMKMREQVTNNAAYFFVALLPYFPYLLKRNKWLSLALLVVTVGFVMYSSKRWAIVTMIVSLLFLAAYYIRSIRLTRRNVFAFIVVSMVLVGGVYYAYITNDWLLGRVEEVKNGGLGLRASIFKVLIDYWCSDGDWWAKLFGNGTSYSIVVGGNYAHNDWLELLIDNGVLGVGVYLMIFITFFRFIYRASLSLESRWAVYLCVVVLFMQTILSMGYASMENSLYMMLLGLIVGSVKVEPDSKKGLHLW